ncbi:EAL domain-containing protein [Saliniramus fredricksonii]|uniref:EAL domain, c-di-GMP-specific phosphodiesterase class I (Or its enzymatically inactive variant) n=2 Tax=Saliniramus fredricksonii TaxID=1653334 RepID=A0ABY0KCG7_9HYPH|nr:EAL domain, c-di-GMP-specific phosphodiesterase class I (or its enzymatically inactive variant) [Saliniramus fredricksonii]
MADHASICRACRDGNAFETPFSMAFQPIVNRVTGAVFAYEALVRGPAGEGAGSVLGTVDDTNRYAFDQAARVRALELAARLDLPRKAANLSINFLPNAVYRPEACIRTTLETAARVDYPIDSLIFELTEGEAVADAGHLTRIVESYRKMGFKTAIDDFGAGYSGLNLLARFQPDIVKLDMELVRGIDQDRVRRVIVSGIMRICDDLGIAVIGEGVETVGESAALCDLGIALQQGYLFARPGFETLPDPVMSAEPACA